jgi:hypothetical protein
MRNAATTNDLAYRFRAFVESLGLEYRTGFSRTNGTSNYLYVRMGQNELKYRFSDHSCGDRRVLEEISIFDEQTLEDAMLWLGYINDPESYDRAEYVSMCDIQEAVLPDLDRDGIISAEPFITKKGKHMWNCRFYNKTRFVPVAR